MTGSGDPVPRRAEGLAVERLEWLPADDGSGLIRAAGRWSGVASPPAGPPVLVVAREGEEPARIEALPGSHAGREPGSWHAAYVVERPLVTDAVLALQFADESGVVLPALGEADGDAAWDVGAELTIGQQAAAPRVNEPGVEVEEPPAGAQVVDRAVLAERRARRAELSEQAQARIATKALKAVELLEQRSADIDRRLAAAETERDELRRKAGAAGMDSELEDRLRQADTRASALQAELEAERQRAASAEHEAREAATAAQTRIEALSADARAAREALDSASPTALGAVIERLTRERDEAVARLASERGELRGSLAVVAELREQARAYRGALREGEAARSSAELRLMGMERTRRRAEDLAPLRDELASRDHELAELRDSAEAAARDLAELRDATGPRDQELVELRETAEARGRELTELRDAAGARDQELAELRETAVARERELAALRATAGGGEELADLRATAMALEHELGSLRATVGTREQELSDLRETAEAREGELSDLRGTVELRDGELAERDRALSELRTTLSARDRELIELRATSERRERELRSAARGGVPLGGTAPQLAQLRAALAERDALLASAAETVGEARAAISTAREQIARSEAEIAELRGRLEALEREGVDGVAQREREAAERVAKADREALAARLRSAEAERVQATIRLARLDRSLTEANARVADLEARAAEAERAAEALREQQRPEGSADIGAELQTLRRLANDAAAALAAERERGEAVRAALAAERERVAALTEELDAARSVAEDVARTGENVAARIRERESELAEERARAASAERARAADAERLRQLEGEHARALDTARSAVSQLEEQLAAVRAQLAPPAEDEAPAAPRRSAPDPERLAADLDAAAAALRARVAPMDDDAAPDAEPEPPAAPVDPATPDPGATTEPAPTATEPGASPEPAAAPAAAEPGASPEPAAGASTAPATPTPEPAAAAPQAPADTDDAAQPPAPEPPADPTPRIPGPVDPWGVEAERPAVVAAGAIDPDAAPSKPVEPATYEPPENVRTLDRSGGWLRGALLGLARDDRERATKLLVELLPGQHLLVEDQPFDYDLLLADGTTYEVTVGPRRTVVAPPAPRDSRRDPMFEVQADVVSLLEVLCGKRRLGRFRGRVRARGHRSIARTLLRRLRTATPSLDALLQSGVTLTPELVAAIVPYAIDPLWTAGHDFCVGLAVTGEPAAWYLRSVDGAGVTVHVGQPPEGVEIDARMRLTRKAFAALLAGRLAAEPHGLEISGEREPIDLLLRWAERVARDGELAVAE